MAKAGPILLEPISELVVTAPEANQGDLMGDLNSKRGRIQGASSVGNGDIEIVAMVPTSEILRYAIDLRSMTGGRGRFEMTHSHYDPVPSHLVDKLPRRRGAGEDLVTTRAVPHRSRPVGRCARRRRRRRTARSCCRRDR